MFVFLFISCLVVAVALMAEKADNASGVSVTVVVRMKDRVIVIITQTFSITTTITLTPTLTPTLTLLG